MENHKLVLPEHLNHFGYLFGGYMLQWVDEYAWIAASLQYPGCQFVTIGMDKVEFKKSVRKGTILKFVIERARMGTTSIQYNVGVYQGKDTTVNRSLIFSTKVTLVNVNEEGKKTKLTCPEASK